MATSLFGHMQTAFGKAGGLFKWLLLALAVLYVLSGIYSVSSNELGVQQRFGRLLDAAVPPGIHYRLPWPIDSVRRIAVDQVLRIHVEDFGAEGLPGMEGDSRGWPEPGVRFPRGTALTGDNNLVNLDCVVQYRVIDPAGYLFGYQEGHAERLLYDAACSTVIQTVAGIPVDVILTTGKGGIERRIKERLQEIADESGGGLTIAFVELKKVQAPGKVKKYFDDVKIAKQDKETTIYKAESYNNVEIPAARSRAVRLIEEAEGYRSQVVAEAEGDTQRFLELLSAFEKSRDITRRRLLLDVMRQVLTNIDKAYIVTSHGDAPPDLKILKR